MAFEYRGTSFQSHPSLGKYGVKAITLSEYPTMLDDLAICECMCAKSYHVGPAHRGACKICVGPKIKCFKFRAVPR